MNDRTNSDSTASPRRRLLMNVVLPGAFVLVAAMLVGATIFAGGDDKIQATLPAGSLLTAALDHTVSTRSGEVGHEVRLETVQAIPLEGEAVLPAGTVIRGEVTHSKGGGRVAGAPELTLRFTELKVDGEAYRIEAQPFLTLPVGQQLRIRLAEPVTVEVKRRTGEDAARRN